MSMASSTVKTGRKNGDDLENVLHKLLLKRGWVTLSDADDFYVLRLTDLEYQLRTKAKKTIFVGEHETLHLVGQKKMQQSLEPLFVHVESRTQIMDQLKAPATACTKPLKQGLLTHEVRLLIAAGNSRIGYCFARHRLLRSSLQRSQLSFRVPPLATLRPQLGFQLARSFPATRGLGVTPNHSAASQIVKNLFMLI